MTDLQQLGMIRLPGGLPEALHYLRQPVAIRTDQPVPTDAWTRWPTAGHRTPGDMPPIHEVWLGYPDAWVVTLTHASPMLAHIGDQTAAVIQIGGWAQHLRGPDREWPETRLYTPSTPPPGLGQLPAQIAVAVTGDESAVDHVLLRLAEPEHRATVHFGPFPRFAA